MSFITLALVEPGIIEHTLSFLYNSKKSLCSVCRVHRSLTEPASSMLYHTLTIQSLEEIEDLYVNDDTLKDVGR